MKKRANTGLGLAIIAGVLPSVIAVSAQDVTPTPQTTGQPVVTAVEVIVTGSNIPTSEEVGPNPVDTYRREDITRLGVRSATDLIQKLPAATGAAINENVVNSGDGRVEINLRGLLAKETLVLQDGRRLAPVGFAGDTVDLNTIPLGLIDHIDVLKDGASAIYGADAVAGVFNVWLIHKFRGLEIYTSYGNTNLGFANDAGEERGYLLAGTGDDKTDIVVYAEFYNRAAIYSRDADISSNANFKRFGGEDGRSNFFAGHISTPFLTKVQPDPDHHPDLFDIVPTGDGTVLDPGRRTPTNAPGTHPFAFYTGPTTGLTAGAADAAVAFNNRNLSAAGYVPRNTVDRASNDFLFNYAELTPAIPAVGREYFYGSLDRKICDQYLELFADFKYTHSFWDTALAPVPFFPDVWTDTTHPFLISNNGISVPIQNAFNPFGRNQNSRAVIDKIFVTAHHLGTTSLTLEDLKLIGDLFDLPAGPISFAVGGEHRTERASDQPDAHISANQLIGGASFAPTDGIRDVWSIYWELRVPVTSPAWNLPGLYSLELDYQERFENFSDFGGTERPKFSARWQPIDSALTFRATYSEAYHAPTLSDLFRGVEVQIAQGLSDRRSPATPFNVTENLSGN